MAFIQIALVASCLMLQQGVRAELSELDRLRAENDALKLQVTGGDPGRVARVRLFTSFLLCDLCSACRQTLLLAHALCACASARLRVEKCAPPPFSDPFCDTFSLFFF